MLNKIALSLLICLSSQPAFSSDLQYRNTTCNVRYNNKGIIAGDVKCNAWFNSSQKLQRVRYFYPQTKKWYDWDVSQAEITSDPRWKECIRYTHPQEGNQWQICTVPSPSQLKIKSF